MSLNIFAMCLFLNLYIKLKKIKIFLPDWINLVNKAIKNKTITYLL